MKLATGLKRPSRGHRHDRRQGGRRAAQDHRHGVPVVVAAAVADDARQRPAAARDRRAAPIELPARPRRLRREGDAAAAKRRPRRLRGPLPVAALGRNAAARVDLPRPDPRAEDAAPRRAVRRARRVHARGALVHPARPLVGAALQRHPRHPRPARGGVPRRHRLRHEPQPRPDGGAARDRAAAAARSRADVHQGVHRHRPRAARAHRRDLRQTRAQRRCHDAARQGALGALAAAGRDARRLGDRLPRPSRSRSSSSRARRGSRRSCGSSAPRSPATPGARSG